MFAIPKQAAHPDFTFSNTSNTSFEEQLSQQSASLTDVQLTDLKPHGAYMTATLNIPINENEKPVKILVPKCKVENTTFEIRVDVVGKNKTEVKHTGMFVSPGNQSVFGGVRAPAQKTWQYSLYIKTETLSDDEEVACFFTSKYLKKTKMELPASSKKLYALVHESDLNGNTLTFDVKFEVVKIIFFTVDRLHYYNKMYDDTDLIDFELKVDDGSVKLHKFVLAASSAIFKREFGGNWKNANEGSLHVSGFSKLTLENFKKYLYLRQIPMDCKELLLLGNYYQMPHLERECIQQLVETCTEESFLEQCEFAVEHKLLKYLIALLKKIEAGDFKVDSICKASLLNRLVHQ
ncbi:hypothetical protein O0L34_g17994 [Tuta absoluta]|nr:hypothetical protein O0L34_g17994 [Tuta absoluta]